MVGCSSIHGFHLDAMMPPVLSCRASGDKRVTKALGIVLSCRVIGGCLPRRIVFGLWYINSTARHIYFVTCLCIILESPLDISQFCDGEFKFSTFLIFIKSQHQRLFVCNSSGSKLIYSIDHGPKAIGSHSLKSLK